jgi:hypothetical protein
MITLCAGSVFLISALTSCSATQEGSSTTDSMSVDSAAVDSMMTDTTTRDTVITDTVTRDSM